MDLIINPISIADQTRASVKPHQRSDFVPQREINQDPYVVNEQRVRVFGMFSTKGNSATHDRPSGPVVILHEAERF